MMHELDVVRAQPSKEFFIDMITRDLTISDSILDLVDNSIDQAVETTKADVMKYLLGEPVGREFRGRRVSLNFSQEALTIQDNCGGISVPDARDRVFLFGSPEERGAPGGLSVYGIGMKRAFFKLGRLIHIESATKADWFVIDIDVDEWQAREDWTFKFTAWGKRADSDTKHEPAVTKIAIKKLRPEAATRLAQVSFRKELARRLASTYALFINGGLELEANTTRIPSSLPEIGVDVRLKPARKLLAADGVRILILASITPTNSPVPGGWYVFCNGRMVLEADRSHVTGWGETLPQWHNKYAHFAGYVYFSSEDVRRLPWTTTKQGVVSESSVYQTALREMQVQARPVLSFLNKLYPSEPQAEEIPEREVLHKLKLAPITALSQREGGFAVQLPKRKADLARVSIQYTRPRRDVKRIREHLGKPGMSASKVGEYTFDYFLKVEISR